MTTRDYIVAYHGTASVDVESIKAKGLMPAHGHGADSWATHHGMHVAELSAYRPPSVFVTPIREYAAEFAQVTAEETKSKPVVLKLHIPKEAFNVQFTRDERSLDPAYRSEQPIPPAWIVGTADNSTNGPLHAS